MYEYDELRIYRGRDIQINKNLIITQPTIDEVELFGEKIYFQSVHTLCSVGADLKWQLWDMGIDYTQISDYELFIKMIAPLVSSRKKLYQALIENPEQYTQEMDMIEDLDMLLVNPMKLLIKYTDDTEFDFADFVSCTNQKNNELILYNPEKEITIDRLGYKQIVDIVRTIHGFKRNNQVPANEQTKMDLIEDARDEAMIASKKPFKSVLKPLVSSLLAKTGQLGSDAIWNTKINMFFDAVKRFTKIQDAESLIQGAYSGFANLKGVDKSRFDWTGDI